MKKYLILTIAIILALTLISCGEDEPSVTEPPAPTTTAVLTERAPTEVVKMADIPSAATPNETFSHHPALALWDDTASIPFYADYESIPSVVPYLSEGSEGLIVLVQGTTPDGAYYENEGAPVAEYLCTLGYDVLVCKYRVTDAQTAREDIRRAVSYALYHASELGVNSTKVALMGFGNGALLCYLACCDYESLTVTDTIDSIPAKPAALLLFNPDMTDTDGPFAGATPEKAIPMSQRVGIYYDARIPSIAEVTDFAYRLKDEMRVLYAEIHSLDLSTEYCEGGDRAESYAELYSLMQTYLKAIKFN